MSFQRIILTSAELRSYKPTLPILKPHPLQALFDKARPTGHVTAEFAFAVAADLLGLDQALVYVKATPAILSCWIQLVEEHGWNQHLEEKDLQINLILNAIKITAANENLADARKEARIYELITNISGDNKALEHALVSGLILNRGRDLPWALVATLPPDASAERFGVWSNKHYK